MRFSAMRTVWLVAATLSVLATPTFASATVSFVCEGDLIARRECCCPEGHDLGTGPGASVSAACCCRVSRADVPEAPAIAQPPLLGQHLDGPVLFGSAVPHAHDVVAPSARAWPAIRLANPPLRAVPILLAKQSRLV
jgi:hypothetical protein